MLLIQTSNSERERCEPAYSHNRIPFSNPLRKSLSPKLFPVTACGQTTGREREVREVKLELQQLLTMCFFIYIWIQLHQLEPIHFSELTRPNTSHLHSSSYGENTSTYNICQWTYINSIRYIGDWPWYNRFGSKCFFGNYIWKSSYISNSWVPSLQCIWMMPNVQCTDVCRL